MSEFAGHFRNRLPVCYDWLGNGIPTLARRGAGREPGQALFTINYSHDDVDNIVWVTFTVSRVFAHVRFARSAAGDPVIADRRGEPELMAN